MSDEVLSKLELDRSILGKVYESQEVTGTVTKKASEITGLSVGTPVVGGAGDQAAGAVGNGIVKSGIVSSTIGTSGVVFAYTDKVTIDPKGRVHTFCHAVPNTWHIMGVTQGAGLSLQWFRNNFCNEEISTAALLDIDSYQIIDDAAALSNVGSNNLIYLPYLMEKELHIRPILQGSILCLSSKHDKRCSAFDYGGCGI